VIALPTLIILQTEERNRVSPVLYAMELMIFAVFILIEPIFTAGIFASGALVESSLRKRAWVSFLNTFPMIYAARVVIAFVMQTAGIILLYLILTVFEGGNDGDIPGEAVLYLCAYCIIGSLVAAFFLEWIPPGGAVLMISSFNTEENLYIFFWLLLTFIVTYIITPPILIRLLAERSVRRLHRRER
jgi:hypothetical protein